MKPMREPTDLLIRNGVLFDSDPGTTHRKDLAITGGLITAVDDDLDPGTAARVLDVRGALVAPGLVDMHAHVFSGQDLGVDVDLVGPASATTTSTGSDCPAPSPRADRGASAVVSGSASRSPALWRPVRRSLSRTKR